MANTVDKVLAIAEAEVGYLEKKSNSQLYDKTANAGSANYTKYGKEMHDLYPSVMDFPAAWCDCFVDWCFYKAYGMTNAKALLSGDFNDYTVASAQLYKNKGAYYKTNPKIGDQIFFKNDVRICHTGLVYKVDTSKVYTIEGNTSGANGVIANGGGVCKKSYPINYSKIDGYGRPKYDIKSSIINTSSVSSTDYGIDVSSYQGVIDWNKVKSAGCEFAILKIIRKDLNPDTQFENNVKGCDNVGMRWDVYNYSYATTVAKAKSDAEKVISILNGRKSIVWLDVEDSCQKNLGHLLIDIINNYKAVIEASGNAFGVYTGLSFYNSYIKPYASEIDCPFWIARYYNGHNQMNFGVVPNSQYKPAISHPLYGWQYTSSGKISGVSGNVDVNIRYMDNVSSSNYSSSSASNSSTHSKLCGYVTANHLNIRKYPNSNKDTPIVGTLNCGDDVHITAYNNGWFEVDTNEWVSGKYIKGSKVGKVNASSLNFRSTPEILSTNKIKSYPKNTKVEIVGESGDWYITKYGYCSKKYITLI